jgi:hypothetical protein
MPFRQSLHSPKVATDACRHGRMKMNIEFDEDDPTQVANELVRMLTLAIKLGVGVETKDDSYSVTNPGDEECLRRWIGHDGEYRRDVMQRRWVVKESTDTAGRQIPAPPE